MGLEKPRLIGDIYDIIGAIVAVLVGANLIRIHMISQNIGYLYGGTLLVSVFGGMLLLAIYARKTGKFKELKFDRKTITIFSVFILIGIIIGTIMVFLT